MLLPLSTTATSCCSSSVADGAIDAATAERIARVFKALADPTRVRLLSLIAATETGEACICDLTEPVGLAQPTVSHHMKQLVEAGLAAREQRGRWAYYRVVDGALAAAARTLRSRMTSRSGYYSALSPRIIDQPPTLSRP